jgi:thioredoxin reductase (NADPH)
MSQLHEVIIVGSGPAGYTAAIYAARASLAPILFCGLQPGGQLTITSEVENWPGEATGIMGPELMEHMKAQAERFGTTIFAETITKITRHDDGTFALIDSAGKEYGARAVILATGASAKWLGVPGEDRLQGKGVSACATCDGFFFRGKEVAVIGGGDSAMEEATFLTRFASKVSVIHRSDSFKASKIMLERAQGNPKISFIMNSVVEEVLGDSFVEALRIKDVRTSETHELPIGGLFVAIGHKPNTEIVRGILELDAVGYVVTEPYSTATSVPGIFAAGDVADHKYRQAITAAGMGCMAALDAQRYLEKVESTK